MVTVVLTGLMAVLMGLGKAPVGAEMETILGEGGREGGGGKKKKVLPELLRWNLKSRGWRGEGQGGI